jgi:hypothetical protein
MTLRDKVSRLARPLEPGSKTKQDESTVAEAAVARHERESVVSRGWYYCVGRCRVVCLGKVGTGCFTRRSCRESKRLG